MEDLWIKCNIHYYCREKYYSQMYKISKAGSSRYSQNVEYPFYCGIAHILAGQIQKGILELTPLQSNQDVQLGVILALMYANKKHSTGDREALHSLDSKLKEERKRSTALSLYYAGLFLSLAEKFDKAADYIAKSLKKDANNVDAIILRGWNDMYMNDDKPMSISDCFDMALNKSNGNVEATLGLAKFRYCVRNHDSSNLLLDKLIVNHITQVVPLVEKMKNEFAMKKWESVLDTMERIFIMDPENIEALKIRIFLALCKNADYIDATDQLNKFFTCLENIETHNGFQFFETARLFSRICGRSSTVLSQVYRFAQYASEMYSTNVEYLSEIGHQCLFQGKTKDAHNFYRAASKIDSNSITALCGLTLCQMSENGPTEQVSEQVELLLEMQGSVKLPVLLLLSAKLCRKDSFKAISLLEEATIATITRASKQPYGLQYIKELDPEFLMEVYKEYQQHLPKKPFIIIVDLMYNEDTSNNSAKICFQILETIYEACPGLISAVFELAKLKFLYGFSKEAQKLIQQVLELDNTHAGSYILLAQIYIQQQLFVKAAQNLEVCLSYNFKVRDSAMYHLINGIILKSSNKNPEALASFTTSLQILHGMKNNVNTSFRTIDSEFNITDKATLYLQLIEVRAALGQFSEAGKTMQEAIQEFSYTPEEGRLVLAKSELALKNGDVDRAIDLLSEIKFGQPYYFQAHTKMAHIYLKEKNDRAMFASCFRDVVSNHPAADSHTMMGDAYMSVNEPELAVEAYEKALNTLPKSIQLVQKMCQALVRTHQFTRATQLYETSMELMNDDQLKFEYIELLIKLKQYDKADSAVTTELELPHNKSKDVTSLKRRVRFLLLQSKARELKSGGVASNNTLLLTEAKELQTGIVKRIEIDSRGDIHEEKQLLSSVLCSLAKTKCLREPAVAANLYAEALINVPRDPDTLLALAKLYAQMNNSEKCEQTCAILLNTDPNNESAAVMMADLAFRKVDLDTAQRHLAQILSVNPTSWEALAQLVEVQWRRGKLSEAEEALEAAKAAMGTDNDPGYCYCAGVCATYASKPNAALRLLNQCRVSLRWSKQATRRMVLLCLTQDAPSALTDTLLSESDVGDTRLLAIRTAEKLLAEVSPQERRPLQALLQLAARQKSQAERVLQELLPLATDESFQEDPFVVLALANAYNIIKQPTRAKNILKRTISSIPWTPENADGLERCWLEVVETQISGGRGEAARELLNKIIQHNKSCSQAYQYLGHLAEKEQNYKQATHNYNAAWTTSGKTNHTLGYKLAQCYLKHKKYPECIVICRHVLKANPQYPKIRKEILEKAKTNLRT